MSNHHKDLAHLRRRVAHLGGPDAAQEFTLIINALHQLALEHIPPPSPIPDLISASHTHAEELVELSERVNQLEADMAAIARALRFAGGP
ncbi:hypothetical protein ES703_26473 [subsurface metagenome]